jgi:hypothetical protein
MNLHQVTYETTEDDLTRRQFFTSGGDASKFRTALKADKTVVGKPVQEAVDVPTTKADLLEWLNKNATILNEK